MPHYMDYFPARFASARDVATGDRTVTIASIGAEDLKNAEGATQRKLVLYFRESDVKPLVMNKTNARALASLHGEDTDGWIGQRITLTRAEVEAFGKRVFAVRVRLSVAPPPSAPAPLPPARKGKGKR